MKLKINNLKDDKKILWKIKPCKCAADHQVAEDSMPRETFKVKEPVFNNGKSTGKTIEREIKTITIKRGSHDDIIGWEF
jgi:hypothetical protein|tara:strand:+ start:312 stop:548 length:237 start_codon:yes stop_codon:yes gene_type:complete